MVLDTNVGRFSGGVADVETDTLELVEARDLEAIYEIRKVVASAVRWRVGKLSRWKNQLGLNSG